MGPYLPEYILVGRISGTWTLYNLLLWIHLLDFVSEAFERKQKSGQKSPRFTKLVTAPKYFIKMELK